DGLRPGPEVPAHRRRAGPARMPAHPLLAARLRQPEQVRAARRPLVGQRGFAERVEPVAQRGHDPLVRPRSRPRLPRTWLVLGPPAPDGSDSCTAPRAPQRGAPLTGTPNFGP